MLPSKADFSFYRWNAVRKCNKNYLQKKKLVKITVQGFVYSNYVFEKQLLYKCVLMVTRTK